MVAIIRGNVGLDMGTRVSKLDFKRTRAIGLLDDDAGHILGRRLGGKGESYPSGGVCESRNVRREVYL